MRSVVSSRRQITSDFSLIHWVVLIGLMLMERAFSCEFTIQG